MEEKKEIIVSRDYNKIKDITFTDPNLMADDAKEKVTHLYYTLQDKKWELHKYREKVRSLEEELKRYEADYNRISPLFNIEFETKEKEYITHESSIGLRGLGNDLIGRSSIV